MAYIKREQEGMLWPQEPELVTDYINRSGTNCNIKESEYEFCNEEYKRPLVHYISVLYVTTFKCVVRKTMQLFHII